MKRTVTRFLWVVSILAMLPGFALAAPTFSSGNTASFTICQNAAAVSLDGYLAVDDLTAGTLTWSINSGPAHGSLNGFSQTQPSGGFGITPAGTTYQPTVGYSGTDNFIIRVVDNLGNIINKSFTVTITALPAQPGNFTVSSTTVCAGQNNVTYTVPSDPNVTSYTWGYSGNGASIAAAGNTANISFAANATSGTVSVYATNACGTSVARTIAVTVTAVPSQPSVITGTSPVCQGQTGVSYSVTNDPSVTTYNWFYTGSGGTINGSGNSITMNFSNTATSGTLTVTGTNSCGTSTQRTFAITVNSLPSAPASFTASTATVCQGQNNVVYTVPSDPTATSYNWSYSGANTSIVNSGNSAFLSYGAAATSGILSVSITNSCGTSSALNLPITVNSIPAQPGSFTVSSTTVCAGQSNVQYSVPNVAGVTYTWTYSGNGASITNSGNTAYISFSASATSGVVSVTASNACGTSTAQVVPVTVNTVPSQPGNFTASTATVCQGQTGVVYTIPNDPTVTSYNWTYSGAGGNISGSGNSITMSFSASATSGTLSVTATNACGTSTARTLSITVNSLPTQPSNITGNSTVCQGQNNVAYSVTNVAGNSYTWSYSGGGATINGVGNAITINFSATATSGTLSVFATNACGTSATTVLAITVNPLPTQPANFTASSATVCQGQSGVVYTVPNDPTVTSYNWTYSGAGGTINGSGNSITMNFSNTATSGTLSVTATNACGTSTARTIAITVNPLPSQPANFSVFTTPVCAGQTGVVYTVPNDPTITTYTWTYSGAGGTITGSGNSITMNFSNTATSGTLSVTATNACGTSTARTLAVTVNPLPSQPGVITGTTPVCQGQNGVAYSVTNDPTVTYTWTYSGAGGTINGTGNAITMNFSNTATSGTLSVTATNACGTSTARTFAITVNPLPSQPSNFTVFSSSVCQGQTGVVYTVPNDPTVTTYNWTYSGAGGSINGSGNSITMNFSATATSGTLSVTATNACGTSTARTIAITVNTVPSQPAAFNQGLTTVCAGQTGVVYGVPNDPNATSYTWVYSGLGATITGTGNTVSVDFSNTATSGTMSVSAVNACGTSIPRTMSITVTPIPSQPGNFTTFSSTVCQGQNGVAYTVPNDPTVTTYTWSYSGTGGTIIGSGNSITMNFNNTATSGTLSVTGTNACGTSIARTINITVNGVPAQPLAFTQSSATVCQGQTGVVYTVPNDPTATSYTWTYSGTGATISGTSNTVVVDFSNTATSGTLSVVANNSCGSSPARSIAITVNTLPAQPGAFLTGPATVCQGQNNVVYSVPLDPSVSYTWSYSGFGATIVTANNTASISFSNTATSGTVNVYATNACGNSTVRSMLVTVNPLPTQPAAFITSSSSVCQGQNNVTYTVPNDPTVTYVWSYTGSGATINGTGNSVLINFSATATSGTLNVTANNACGTSTPRSVNITVNPLPAQPANFTTFTSIVCQGQNNVAYTVPNDPTVTYTWSYSGAGATITGTGNSVLISYANNATSGTLSVTATNVCGTSTARTIAVTVNPLPNQPGLFTTFSATVCQGQNNVAYAVPNDPTVSYNWSYSGTGATISPYGDSVSINFSNTATNGTLSVTATNGCGTSAARTLLITVNPLPNQPGVFTTSSPTVCQGQNGVVYAVPFDPTVTYTWSYSGLGATINGTSNTVSVDFSTTATSGTLVVTANNGCGASTPRTLAITVNPLPAQPLAFTTSSATVCQAQTGVIYTVPLDVTATGYTWQYSGTGATINGTTNSVTVDFSNTATSGTLSVWANNACGASATPRTIAITVNPLPLQPAAFTQSSATVCQGQNGVVYVVPAVANATSYTWTYSGTGATITSFGDSAIVDFATTATSGTISVTATNACGTSAARTLAVTVNPLPNQPAAFTASTATVCQGVNGVTYTVPNDPTVTYTWTYSGTGVTINGTGNSVTLNFGLTATSGTLSVTANNACGTSAARTIAITVNPLPLQPGVFTAFSNPVCQGQNNVVYTVPNDPTATSYTWTYSGLGATITGSTNSVTINFSASATSGTLSVVANNACGASPTPRTLAITVNPLPAQPSPFTASSTTVCQGQDSVFYAVNNDTSVSYIWSYTGAGATILNANLAGTYINFANNATSGTLSVSAVNGCGLSVARTVAVTVNPLPNQPFNFTTLSPTVCQGQNNVTYTVPNDPTVTYAWSYSGTGATITPIAPGNSATVNFSATATSGTLSVTASNSCGTSAARTIAITVNPLPAQPAAFTTFTNPVCQGQSNVSYAVPFDPAVTYTWAYSGTGATITPTAVGDSVVVSFNATATSGNLSVTATNSCGTSAARTLAIVVNPLPTQPGAFTASSATVCQGQTGVVYTVPNNPLVTYTWTYSGTGATINGTGNSVTVDFSATATSGTLSVTATNACGTSTARTIAITVNPLPATPGAFTVFNASPCQGQTNVTYTVPNVAGVTYTWTYSGFGATITGAGNSVNINFSNTATSGTLSVTATNGCGTSAPRTLAINVRLLPNQPNGFTTFSSVVCQGQTGVVYTVPLDTAITTYNWTYSGTGAIISAAGNSATVDFSATATSGNLSVTATNSCGTSAPRTIAVTVNQPPSITTQPVNRTICQGSNTTFNVVATGTAITYQWQVNDGTGWVDLTNTAPYSGVTTATLSITTATFVMNGYQYRVVVSGSCPPAATSNAATLTVNTSPTLVSQSPSVTVCEGDNALFSITATGTGLNYQWQVDPGTGFVNVPAAPPYSGGTTATLTITGVTTAMDGYNYRVIVTGSCAPVATSGTVTLNVNALPAVTTDPIDATACAGSSATFTVGATGAGITYQWQENTGSGFVNISDNATYNGTTTATLTINGLTAAMSGNQYRVVVTGTCPPPAISNFATLTVSTTASWTGVINTAWSNPGNWSCNTLPNASTDVFVPTTAPNMPLVDIPGAICNNLTIDPAASVAFTGVGNKLELKGSVTNNGTFDPSLGEVILSGDVNQFVPGAIYQSIRLDGQFDKTIQGVSTVTDSVVLNKGYLIIGNNDLTVTSTGAIYGGDSTSFIVTNGTGKVIDVNVGFGGKMGNIKFPVGATRNSYTPLTLANNGVADAFAVQVYDNIYSSYTNDIPTSPALTDNAVAKTWIVQEGTPGSSNVSLTLQWNSYDELPGFNRSACYLSHYIDPIWHPGLTGPAFGSGPFNVTLAGITTFSPFGVASAGSPLLVHNTSNDNDDIMVFPNPVTGSEMYVRFENAPKGDVAIRIIDMLGKVVAIYNVDAAQFRGGTIPVKVSDLANGDYMLQLTDKNNAPLQTIKFTKQ
ncbi:MAG: T9SS type A sorting domain-containing protein [Bacteroidetes bacterium]|nr:T9SS type A sorting domain-containing protein [Bacteroidota bacterium]